MHIKNFLNLKENKTFNLLSYAQAAMDKRDYLLQQQFFTRSPFQLLSFLIAYAGLNPLERTQVVSKLAEKPFNLAQLSQEKLDELINAIDWEALLKKDPNSQLQFEFSIEIFSKTFFIQMIGEYGPKSLFKALIAEQESILKISENRETVKFFTKIKQEGEFTKELKQGDDLDFWEVEDYILSKYLKSIIKVMASGEVRKIGGFTISKGVEGHGIELKITRPQTGNKFEINVENFNVNPGIYNAFKGMKGFYGLDQVDIVEVELTNNAEFSDKGAKASQTQIVTYINENASWNAFRPTTITVDLPLAVYFYGIDIWCEFSPIEIIKGGLNKDNIKNDIYIELNTKSDGISTTGIFLCPQRMNHFDPELSMSIGKKLPLEEKPTIEKTPPIDNFFIKYANKAMDDLDNLAPKAEKKKSHHSIGKFFSHILHPRRHKKSRFAEDAQHKRELGFEDHNQELNTPKNR